MNSVIEAQQTYLSVCLNRVRYHRVVNYYFKGAMSRERNYAREQREDEYNEILNKQWEIELLDRQRR